MARRINVVGSSSGRGDNGLSKQLKCKNDNAMELSIKCADEVSVVTYGCVGLHHRARASMNPMTKNKKHFCFSMAKYYYFRFLSFT